MAVKLKVLEDLPDWYDDGRPLKAGRAFWTNQPEKIKERWGDKVAVWSNYPDPLILDKDDKKKVKNKSKDIDNQ